MSIYFAVTDRPGFYDESLHGTFGAEGSTIPRDAVPVSADEHAQLLCAVQSGAHLALVNGRPQAVEPPTPVPSAAFNAERQRRALAAAAFAIAPLQDAVELGVATPAEAETLQAWKLYRVAVNRIDAAAPTIEWPTAPASH